MLKVFNRMIKLNKGCMPAWRILKAKLVSVECERVGHTDMTVTDLLAPVSTFSILIDENHSFWEPIFRFHGYISAEPS